MKSLILFGILFLTANTSFAWIKIEKYNGGFFGYKHVNESSTGGNSMLACADPGRKRCAWAHSAPISDIIINEYQLNDIDEKVNAGILNEVLESSFYYDTNFYVHYSYDPFTDLLKYEIYTLTEAHDLGLI